QKEADKRLSSSNRDGSTYLRPLRLTHEGHFSIHCPQCPQRHWQSPLSPHELLSLRHRSDRVHPWTRSRSALPSLSPQRARIWSGDESHSPSTSSPRLLPQSPGI